uniref:Uncharacterized protein n=1 Tax=Astyanax mexicanus TaxID=7994 RepID=A0A8B9HAC4_ASTMX
MMESCSTLAEVLDIKDSLLRELDLSNNELQDNGMVQLSAGLKKSTIEVIRLNNCSITDVGCDAVASALHSNFSLKELDLDKNKIGQSGVQKLSDLLKNSNCALEKLKLSYNNIKQEGYTSLAAALQSNSSSKLKELDLCGNDPGDKGVQELFNLQRNSKHNLTLRLLKSTAAENAFAHLTKLLQANPLLLEELDLSGKIQGDSVMNQLSALLEDLHCRPKKLKLAFYVFLISIFSKFNTNIICTVKKMLSEVIRWLQKLFLNVKLQRLGISRPSTLHNFVKRFTESGKIL